MGRLSKFDIKNLLKEVKFNFSRSGGKGGQNVNKVETKVEIVFNINASNVLNDEIKERIKNKLTNRFDKDGNLRVVSQTERTQLGNRKKAVEKFLHLLDSAAKPEKKRIKTKKSESSKQKVLDEKRKLSEKKKIRKQVEYFE
jgi:ribosome-associated protein